MAGHNVYSGRHLPNRIRPEALVIIVLMGVAGSGKTTVGALLAAELGWPFYDADSFHSPESIVKMSRGLPLTDEERGPWLERLRTLLVGLSADGQNAVLAYSALKQRHRDALFAAPVEVKLVYLKGEPALLLRRLEARAGHFAKSDLLESQLAALEEPLDALVVPIDASPQVLAREIQRRLALGVKQDLG